MSIIVPQKRVWTRQPPNGGTLEFASRFNVPRACAYVPTNGLIIRSGICSGAALERMVTSASVANTTVFRGHQALRLYADHGGADDDSLRFPIKAPHLGGGTDSVDKYTVICKFHSLGTGSDENLFNAGNLKAVIKDTQVSIGFVSANGFNYYYEGSVTGNIHNTDHTIVITANKPTQELRILFDQEVLVPNNGNSSYLPGSYGNGPDYPVISFSVGFNNYYLFNGYVYLAAYFPNLFLTESESRAIIENPWQIFAKRDRLVFVPLSSGSTLNASASGSATSSGTATLTTQVALAAVGVAVAGGSATAAVSIPLSAAGIAVAGGSANAKATVTISASGLATAAGSAGLSASVLLAGAGAATAAGNATLAAQLAALASGAAQASGTATLTGGAPGQIAASGQATASGSAVLTVSIGIAATGGGQASGSGTLAAQIAGKAAGTAQAGGSATLTGGAPGQIAASGSASAGGSATVGVTVQLTAAGFVRAMGAGQFSVSIPLSAVGYAVARGNAVASISNGEIALAPGPDRYRVRATRRNYLVKK